MALPTDWQDRIQKEEGIRSAHLALLARVASENGKRIDLADYAI